jgi:hypothetical protein
MLVASIMVDKKDLPIACKLLLNTGPTDPVKLTTVF